MNRADVKVAIASRCAMTLILAGHCVTATAQGAAWRPDRPVEIVVNTAPASGPDKTARVLQKIFHDLRQPEVPLTVVNKAGGGGAIAYTYLNQFAANGHYIAIASKSLLTAHVMGRMPLTYTDVTPIAHLFGEYIGVAVRADSPIRSGRDLIERLKKDPNAHSIGVATSLGNTNHQAVAAPLKTAGIDVRKLKNVVFQSGGNAATALLGGHVDVVPVSIGSRVGQLKAGQVRIIAVSSSSRLPGLFAEVPTWREQGADVLVSNWRSVVGPRNMTPAQIAYWEGVIQRAMQTSEWKKDVDAINAVSEYMGSAETRKYMETDYAQIKAFLVDLDLAK
ncbi:MAG TPA: tripartite tricarboxylate transporter substrate binding protein [Burkholderiales bacterium]|nr:tripartite tricarboxylate transporter substrate binding protein [Burkholderiales bacterium]